MSYANAYTGHFFVKVINYYNLELNYSQFLYEIMSVIVFKSNKAHFSLVVCLRHLWFNVRTIANEKGRNLYIELSANGN